MTILKKIDPILIQSVRTENLADNQLDCVVYSNNYFRTKNYLSNMQNCTIFGEFPFIKCFAVSICPSKIGILSSINHVSYIASQAKVFAQTSIAKQVMNIDLLANQGFAGKGITIAFIDTGIGSHLDFLVPKNRIILFKDFINHEEVPYDDNGHGTFVISVAAGSGLLSGRKYSGIAPEANIIALKALDSKGETGAFTILEAMQWVFDNHRKYNIKVVCMSFGSQPLESGDPLIAGAEALWNEGVIVVAAAGNSGPERETIKSPGVSSKIITVGALDDGRDDSGNFDRSKFKIAEFSSRGPAYNFFKPDLIASGVNLTCASNREKEFYTKMSGTSVATPLIAGVSALLAEKFKNISPIDVKGLLIRNCTRLTGDRNMEGFGYFNLS